MKKAAIILLLAFAPCAAALAQQAAALDEAVRDVGAYLSGRLPPGTRVAILNIASDSPPVSLHIMEKLSELLVNDSPLLIVDRRNLELVRQEERYQMSGEVSDETALRIGHKLGAQTIVSGSFQKAGGRYQMLVRAIDVETARVQGITTVDVRVDKTLRELESGSAGAGNASLYDSLHDKNRLYIGARAGLSLGFYENGGGLASTALYPSQRLLGSPSFDGALYAALPLWSLFALQLEAIATSDAFEIFSGNASLMKVSYRSLMIPLLAKLVWRPSVLTVQGFAGAYLSLPMGKMGIAHNNGSYNAGFSLMPGFMAGGGLGLKLGPGSVMADIRYAGDFGYTQAAYNGTKDVSRRNKVFFALGYEIGLLPK